MPTLIDAMTLKFAVSMTRIVPSPQVVYAVFRAGLAATLRVWLGVGMVVKMEWVAVSMTTTPEPWRLPTRAYAPLLVKAIPSALPTPVTWAITVLPVVSITATLPES